MDSASLRTDVPPAFGMVNDIFAPDRNSSENVIQSVFVTSSRLGKTRFFTIVLDVADGVAKNVSNRSASVAYVLHVQLPNRRLLIFTVDKIALAVWISFSSFSFFVL